MKTIRRIFAVSSLCTLGAYAGDTYVPAPAPAPAPAPPTSYSSSHWFLGGGVDYLLDAESAYVNGHLGYDFGGNSSIFVEVGWAEGGEDFVYLQPGINPPGGAAGANVLVSANVDMIPVTANYKFETPLGGGPVSFYIGGGLGMTHLDMAISAFDSTDWVFTAQAFTGIVFNVSESFEIYTGLRYLWIDDSSLFGVNISDLDDFALGAGIRFNF